MRELDHTSWSDIELGDPKLLALLPSTFELACEHSTEVDGLGNGIDWTGHRVWVSDADQALIRVLDDERIGTLVSLAIHDDRASTEVRSRMRWRGRTASPTQTARFGGTLPLVWVFMAPARRLR